MLHQTINIDDKSTSGKWRDMAFLKMDKQRKTRNRGGIYL